MVIFLSRDLLFASRFHSAAAAAAIETQGALSPEQALDAVRKGGVTGICVDLECVPAELIELVSAAKSESAVKVVAYGPHVHEERLAAAAEAGCDVVLSRGQFDRQLADLLQVLSGVG